MRDRDVVNKIKMHKKEVKDLVKDVNKAAIDKQSIINRKDNDKFRLQEFVPEAKIDTGLRSSVFQRLKIAMDVSMGADVDIK